MNRARSLAFAALVAASSVAGLGCARADWREEVPVFRIGILGGGLEERRLKDHACLKAKAEQIAAAARRFRASTASRSAS